MLNAKRLEIVLGSGMLLMFDTSVHSCSKHECLKKHVLRDYEGLLSLNYNANIQI